MSAKTWILAGLSAAGLFYLYNDYENTFAFRGGRRYTFHALPVNLDTTIDGMRNLLQQAGFQVGTLTADSGHFVVDAFYILSTDRAFSSNAGGFATDDVFQVNS